MLELLITVLSLFVYSFLTAFSVWHGVSLLDETMNYPNPFWKIRYWIASKYTDSPFILKKWLVIARKAPIEDKGEIMQAHYNEIAGNNPRFKRWICPYCLSTFIGLIVSVIICIIILSLYKWWTLLYFFSVFPIIGFLGARD